MTVANTILEQLGGSRFIAMTGAKNLVGSDRELMFSIGKGAKYGANKVRVILTRGDVYTIETYKIRGADFTVCNSAVLIPAEALRATFTRLTGFDCTL